jgi:diguanylate cyclase (GGDEF)-like protein
MGPGRAERRINRSESQSTRGEAMNGTSSEPTVSSASRRPNLSLPYLYFVIIMGAGAFLYAAAQIVAQGVSYQWLILAGLTVVTGAFSVNIPAVNSKISIGDTLYFLNLILFGPAAGVITAALDGLVGSLRSKTQSRRLQYTLFNVGAMAASALLGGTFFFKMYGRGPLYTHNLDSFGPILLPIVVLSFVHYLLNSGSVAVMVALELRKNVYEIWRDNFLWTSITYFAGAGTAAFVAITIGSITPKVFLVTVPVLLAVHYTYKTYLNRVQEVRSLAYYDSLTGLPNRMLFKERLNQALTSSEAGAKNIAVMFLDLDNFKRVNDTYGHCVGDLLVRQVAMRLSASVRAEESQVFRGAHEKTVVIGRFGGDEFTLLLTGVGTSREVARVAGSLLAALSKPFNIEAQEIAVAASIGIAVCPSDGTDADALLKNADTAMFHAKANGRSGYYFYSQSMNESSRQKLSLENELRKGLERDEFRVHYQPKVDARTGMLTGAEALIRWQHPTRGLLTASEFFYVAEETGLVRPIGEWVFNTVCAQIATWLRLGITPVPVAVNFSAAQFRQERLVESLSRTLRETGVDPEYLELELTEGTIMQNEDEAIRSMSELRKLGVKISVDDFGTGYSSLSRLKHFTLDALKIDRSFVSELADNQGDRAITKAIIAMAHSLNLKVIAEGVETEEQLRFLQQHGCDEIQGWITGRPISAEAFEEKLTAGRLFQTTLGNPILGAVTDRIEAKQLASPQRFRGNTITRKKFQVIAESRGPRSAAGAGG